MMTVTLSGSGGGTETSTTTVFVTRTVAPSSVSTSSSFTCRTYATNYLNGAVPTAVIKKREKRSVFDPEIVIGENDKSPRPGALPQLWYKGLDDRVAELIGDYLEG